VRPRSGHRRRSIPRRTIETPATPNQSSATASGAELWKKSSLAALGTTAHEPQSTNANPVRRITLFAFLADTEASPRPPPCADRLSCPP